MVVYLGSLVQLCCREGETLQTYITGMCGACSQCLSHTGFAPLTACVLTCSTLLRLQVALQGTCLKQALGCMHFPGLSHSGSGSQVLHKGTDSGPAFCALPRSEKFRQPAAWWAHSPRVQCVLSPLPFQPRGFLGVQLAHRLLCLLSGADLWLWPSWWMSTVQHPRRLG